MPSHDPTRTPAAPPMDAPSGPVTTADLDLGASHTNGGTDPDPIDPAARSIGDAPTLAPDRVHDPLTTAAGTQAVRDR